MKPWLMTLFLAGLITPALPARAETWTVLVYWAVDNDLYEFSIPYLRQFEKVGSDSNLNLVVETDYPGTRKSERTLILKDDGTPGRMDQDLPHSFVLETHSDETRSAQPRTLSRFLKWGMKHFPADRYALVIGSHGMNWRGVIEDGNREEVMSLSGVRSVLRQFSNQRGAPLDLMVFDACRMAFGEVAHALRGQARYLLGSQFDVNGFDHVSPLAMLQSNPAMSVRELGEKYVRHYPHADAGQADFSASLLSLEAEKIELLDQDLDAVSHQILTLSEEERVLLKKNLILTRNEYRDTAVDFGHLVEVLTRIRPVTEVSLGEALRRWSPGRVRIDSTGALQQDHYPEDSSIVAASATSGSSPARGVSLSCSPETTAYASSTFGRRHPAWAIACSSLLGLRPQ